MKPIVLVVEDEAALQELLAYNLERAGFAVEQAYDADEARTLIAEQTPDLVLLDWMLPYMSGLELCRQLRRQPATANLPIIMLTARVEERDRLHGLDTGADDYVTKPFSMGELLARMRAVERRAHPEPPAPRLRFGELEVDLSRRLVTLGGTDVRLTPTELRLLEAFVTNPGKLLTHRWLLTKVWGPGYLAETHYVRIYVRALRRKLADDPSRPRYIVTEPGLGYRWRPDPEPD
jgi:two-component system phosphate regulon response regulator PhoB